MGDPGCFGPKQIWPTAMDDSAQDDSAHSDLLRRMIWPTSLKLRGAVKDDSAHCTQAVEI